MFRDSRWRLASLALLVLGLGSAAGAQEANPAPIKDAGGELSIHGFGDWRYARTDGDNEVLSGAPGGSYTFAHLGVAFAKEVNSRLRLEAEALFAGEEHDIDLVYAFADVRLSSRASLRVGQVKQPFGLFSEVVQVGTLRPFIALPQSVYGPSGMAPEAFLGAGLTGQAPLGARWNMQWDAYAGGQNLEEKHAAEEAALGKPVFAEEFVLRSRRNMVGGRALFETPIEGFRFGGAAYSAEELEGSRHNTAIGSIEYVRRPFEFRGELIHQSASGDLRSTGWYAEAAYRLDTHWQLAGQYDHYTVDLLEEPEGTPGPASLREHREGILGVNYWVNPTCVFKVNYSRVDGNRFALPAEDAIAASIAAGTLRPKTNLIQFAVQFAF